MSVVSVIESRLAGFVNVQASATAVDRARLKAFVAVRLGLTAFLMIAAPIWLLTVSSPSAWQCLGFASLLAPICAVFALSRGASLDAAQMVSVAGLIGFAGAIAVGGADYSVLSFAVLLVAVLEAATSGGIRFLLAVGAVAVGGVAAIVLFGAGQGSGGLSQPAAASLIAALICYASALGSAMAYTSAVATFGERRETLRHEALAQTIGDLVVRQDRDGSVVHASSEALPLFALSPRDLMGRGLFDRIHVADRPAFLSTVADALESDATASRLVRLRRGALNDQSSSLADPSFAWIEMRTHRLPQERRSSDPQDSAAVVTIIRDVTRARQAEEDIQAARQRAEQANVWKDRFLANVTHELRTPLNAIIGFAEILANEEIMATDAARRKEYAQIIHSSGHHLLEVVTSILDVSKIDAGSFDIVTEPFSLPPLLDQCCDMMSLRAGKGGVSIIRDYPSEMDELVADKRACKQIIINLMSNAVKFTPSGGTVTLTARPEGNSFLISVADTGIGISAADLEHIGDPFFQAHNTTTRAYEGTGLGLSLVRGLVGLHGGTIAVESALNQGTTVLIRLPAQCASNEANAPLARIETMTRRGSVARHAQAEQLTVRKIA